ncbi:threonine synthase [Pelagibaculum spongiae]|uniref:Threonine synthase n=1 Tax=Pelagibaculum spongiae TaxID=2080658 RepID=A0A2V1GN93_9GAMM|nr:threonine synthase [Pelagibaculum spongiae]PVZ63000.1 threonine synthase [Pelagibaculum spongiae]
MKYISTRGQAPALGFEDVLLAGLASDGGLYVPETLPKFSAEEIASWSGLAYHELAFKIIQPFVADAFGDEELKEILAETYAGFAHKAVAPLVQVGPSLHVMELFHGPTLAFKDFALQLLGRLLDKVLERRKERVVIMGATSGDTGSAAIEGCRRCENLDIFILHPHQRVSEVQRRQMTTILSDNIYNLAVTGNFDDCQRIVKKSFANQDFLKGKRLVAVNSINWARIMAQIVYYFHAAITLGAPGRPVSFSVPTGNFGDIFAGYLAKKMGLPIEQLIVATNSNDILHRIISDNNAQQESLEHTLSPSMDIMVSSNFERLLFDLCDQDGEKLSALMADMDDGSASLSINQVNKLKSLFSSARADDATTCSVIERVWKDNEYLLDPHTAIGVYAAEKCRKSEQTPIVCLATAHPVKFPDAIIRSGLESPSLPEHLADLFDRPESQYVMEATMETVQEFVTARI